NIVHQPNSGSTRDDLSRKLKELCRQSSHVRRYSRQIATGVSLACHQTEANRISERRNDDWNGVGDLLEYDSLRGCPCEKYVWIELHQCRRKRWQAIVMSIGKSIDHVEIPAFCETKFSHSFQKWAAIVPSIALRSRCQPRNHRPLAFSFGQHALRRCHCAA